MNDEKVVNFLKDLNSLFIKHDIQISQDWEELWLEKYDRKRSKYIIRDLLWEYNDSIPISDLKLD